MAKLKASLTPNDRLIAFKQEIKDGPSFFMLQCCIDARIKCKKKNQICNMYKHAKRPNVHLATLMCKYTFYGFGENTEICISISSM